jgi:hypothetical protein
VGEEERGTVIMAGIGGETGGGVKCDLSAVKLRFNGGGVMAAV